MFFIQPRGGAPFNPLADPTGNADSSADPDGTVHAGAPAIATGDPFAKFVALHGFHAGTPHAAHGPEDLALGEGNSNAAPQLAVAVSCKVLGAADPSEHAVTTVQLGESSLEQVARRLSLDPNVLRALNPELEDRTNLRFGEKVRLPQCQAPVPRPVPAQRMREIVAVLALGGTLGDIREGNLTQTDRLVSSWIQQGIRFESRSGTGSFYDPNSRTMVLNAGASAAEQAQAIVFEARKMSIDEHKQVIIRDLGAKEYDRVNSRTNGHANPALKEKYEPKTRDAHVNDKLATVAEAASDAIEFSRQVRTSGAAASAAPLESVYTNAYDRAYNREYSPLAETLNNHRARETASAAGRAAVADAVKNGKLLSGDSREKYADVFNRQWDAKETGKAKQAAEVEKTRAAAKIESERQARIVVGHKALAELISAVDPKSPQADQVIGLVYAFTVRYRGAELQLLTLDARQGLERLLGPYGFMDHEVVGSVRTATARLDYALANFQRLTPQQRDQLHRNPFLAARFGISHAITYEEMQAREAQNVNQRLPDGTTFQGTRAEYREASRRNVSSHALAQIDQIRTAGPISLAGRIVAGEKGAAIGALFDGALPVAAGLKARANVRNGVGSGGADYRAPIDDARRAPAPSKSAPQELQPDRPSSQPPARPPTGGPPPSSPPANTPPPAEGGKKPLPQTNPSMNTGASDPDRVQRRDHQAQWADRAALSAQREAENARRLAAANANAAQVAKTLPGPNEEITPDRALEGMEKQQWPTVASMNSKRHAEAWRDANHTRNPPIVFRDGNQIRIDLQRLNAEQQKRFEAQATKVKAVVGDRNVDVRDGTQPRVAPPTTHSGGALENTQPAPPPKKSN